MSNQDVNDDDSTKLGWLSPYIIVRIVEFQKTIPFVMGAVAIGVGTVNRTLVKSLIHLGLALIAGLVASKFDLGVTAFLFSSIAYVVTCSVVTSGTMDISIKISMPVGFIILGFIDMYVIKRASMPDNFPYMPYIGTLLLSALWGIAGVFVVQNAFPNSCKSLLYDFKGCSCDDCANANTCPAAGLQNSDDTNHPKSKTVLMGRIIKQ
uniref:Uncharacterized protein n=1 Tax=viral metagenome TaxID=1070528 RepID=A0A6C0I408_9ZZZZ